MTLHGSIDEFDAVKEDWSTYAARLDFYFEANGVEDHDRERAILPSVSGVEIFKLMSNLVSPNSPKDYTFKELVELIAEHYQPKKSAAIHRFTFNSRTRNPGETVSTYLRFGFEPGAELRKMLCDRLICVINDARIKHRLLAEPDLDFIQCNGDST